MLKAVLVDKDYGSVTPEEQAPEGNVTVSCLVTNTGELPRYYVYGTHPALIDKATFERVQQRLAPPCRSSGTYRDSASASTPSTWTPAPATTWWC